VSISGITFKALASGCQAPPASFNDGFTRIWFVVKVKLLDEGEGDFPLLPLPSKIDLIMISLGF
jgi:hypothetical protein